MTREHHQYISGVLSGGGAALFVVSLFSIPAYSGILLILMGALVLFLMPEKAKSKNHFKPLSNTDIELMLLKKGWKCAGINNVQRSYKPPTELGLSSDFKIDIPADQLIPGNDKKLKAALLQIITIYQKQDEKTKEA